MRTRDAIRQAKKDGAEAGKAAASWVFDGNTKDETYARMLKGIMDGDPEILDSVRVPNLSGEFAGDPTPQSLAEDYGINEERAETLMDDICTAWENAANETFWNEVERVARFQVHGE